MKKYLLLLTLVVSVAVFYFLAGSKEPELIETNEHNLTNSTQPNSIKSKSASSSKSISESKLEGKANIADQQHTHSFNDEAGSALANSDKSWWFESPVLESDNRFSSSRTPLELDPSCTSADSLDSQYSLEENFEKLTQSNTQERYQEDLFYFSLTQFWKLDENYLQFLAIWDRDMPAVYRYEFYQSKDKGFNQDVTPIDLPIALPKSKDVISTNQYVAKLIAFYQQQGAELGSRILESSINDPEGDQQITLVNSQVTQWKTSKFNCDSGENFEKAYCYCNQGDKS